MIITARKNHSGAVTLLALTSAVDIVCPTIKPSITFPKVLNRVENTKEKNVAKKTLVIRDGLNMDFLDFDFSI